MELQADHFNHPYSPYEIQLQFMRALYSCLEDGKVAVFESPTGTGKSLSLICGALTWLRDHKRKALLETVDKIEYDDSEPQWILDFGKRESRRSITQKKKDLEARLAKTKQEEEKQKNEMENVQGPRKKQKITPPTAESRGMADDQFALDDYDSESEEQMTNRKKSDHSSELSSGTLELLERFKRQYPTKSEDDTHDGDDEFASELRRVSMPSSVPPELNTDIPPDVNLEERIKHLSLGSRKNLCINSRVVALGNSTAINERCMELQQPNVAAQLRCPYIPSQDGESQTSLFRDHALATIKDIEDLGRLGKKMGICPYYASRPVIKHSEIITLPYPLLLQRSAREALNLSIKGHIVIIDEAHNLMDAISNIHSVDITLSQLQTSIYQLTTYARKFQHRLKGKNRSYIAQIIRLVSSIAVHIRSILQNNSKPFEGSIQFADLMAGKGVDQLNPYKLCQYLQESKLARKVDGYIKFSEKKEEPQADTNPTTPVLFHVQSFLLSLMNPAAEGRLFYSKNDGEIQLKYMLLDPTNHFREIVEDAKSVILAGGTMSPMSDYMDHLFSYVPPNRLDMFSYGHIIPSENLIAHPLGKGVHGSSFDFTYAARSSESMILDLGRTVATLCRIMPDGVVAFFPSYEYLTRVLGVWKKHIPGEKQTVYNLIEQRKAILYESQEMTNSSEEILRTYATTVDSGRGALLLSVVGGKLSEGINFADKLGRGVLIIGLPFPNIRSAVWQAKISYVEQKTYNHSSGSEGSRQSDAKAAGRDFYENACMRAVNQCIGRAIRHRNDYAAIILLDRRYEKASVQGKLPGWIRQSMEGNLGPEQVAASLGRFFAREHRIT